MPPKNVLRNAEVHHAPVPPVPMANTKLADEITKFEQDVETFINHECLDAEALKVVSAVVHRQLGRLAIMQKFAGLDFAVLDDATKQALADKLGLPATTRRRRTHASSASKPKPDEKIVKYVRDNPGCSANELCNKLKAGRAGVDYWMNKVHELVASNKIKMVGDKLSVA